MEFLRPRVEMNSGNDKALESMLIGLNSEIGKPSNNAVRMVSVVLNPC